MNKSIGILIVLLLLSAGAFYYMNSKSPDTPKSPPTWGWTKIVTISAERDFGTATEIDDIYLKIDVSKQYMTRVATAIRMENSRTMDIVIAKTHIEGGSATITKSYSNSDTQYMQTGILPLVTTLQTSIDVHFITSNGTLTYYGQMGSDTRTYTFVYVGDDTWTVYYTTTSTDGATTIYLTYGAKIIQK